MIFNYQFVLQWAGGHYGDYSVYGGCGYREEGLAGAGLKEEEGAGMPGHARSLALFDTPSRYLKDFTVDNYWSIEHY